jgi:hypothetical protein
MKSANAIKTYRKSGLAKRRDLQCAIRVPRPYRLPAPAIMHRVLMETPASPLSSGEAVEEAVPRTCPGNVFGRSGPNFMGSARSLLKTKIIFTNCRFAQTRTS